MFIEAKSISLRWKARESISIIVVNSSIVADGEIIGLTDGVNKHMQMDQLTKVIFRQELKMGKVFTNGKTEEFVEGNLDKGIYGDKEKYTRKTQ